MNSVIVEQVVYVYLQASITADHVAIIVLKITENGTLFLVNILNILRSIDFLVRDAYHIHLVTLSSSSPSPSGAVSVSSPSSSTSLPVSLLIALAASSSTLVALTTAFNNGVALGVQVSRIVVKLIGSRDVPFP